MTIIYELNPPKVIQNKVLSHKELEESVAKLMKKAVKIRDVCKNIHITDSVLGIPRISPITAGFFIKNSNENFRISASVRVRDRNQTAIIQTICDAILLNLNGVLLVKGDPPSAGPKDSKMIPSEVVKLLDEQGFGKRINLYLSIPSNPDFDKIQKKIEAQPKGFVTQVVRSTEQVARIVDRLKPQGFRIIPCVLIASKQNQKSASMLNLDWSSYEKDVAGFVKEINKIAGNVLLSSPNDFKAAIDVLTELA